jgi:prevent-host-death family protein
MATTVSAAQANREFSKLMKLVESGEEVVVTSRGRPRMKLVRVDDADEEAAKRQKAFDEFTEWLENRPVLNLPRATRDDMYE